MCVTVFVLVYTLILVDVRAFSNASTRLGASKLSRCRAVAAAARRPHILWGQASPPFGGFAHTGTQFLSSGGLAAALRFCTELLVAIKTKALTHDRHQMRGTIFK